MGEEFRRGWHPETSRPRGSDAHVLIVGAGPAGLEAARALGGRGYHVTLAEATRELGGRVTHEAKLPGLAAWGRVRDYRVAALEAMDNVSVYRESHMETDDIIEFGFEHVFVATGAHWRRDGVGRWHLAPIPMSAQVQVLTPDDLFAGQRPQGSRVVLFDDDHYYMGGVIAEMLAKEGFEVTIVTPESLVSPWTEYTFEVDRIQRRLIEAGVTRLTNTVLTAVNPGEVVLHCVWTDEVQIRPADSVVIVTARLPEDGLLRALQSKHDAGLLASVRGIGDCWAPGTIAAAVYAGRKAAEEFGESERDNVEVGFRREVTALIPIDELWPSQNPGADGLTV